jgi:hypothetical protein
MFALFAAFACMTCIAIPLTAQDVTVTPPTLFDMPDNSDQPDTPPKLLKNWSPSFSDKLFATTEPGYAILTQVLDEKGKSLRDSIYSYDFDNLGIRILVPRYFEWMERSHAKNM